MRYPRAQLVRVLIQYFGDDDRRIEHALRVLYHAERLMENHPSSDPDIVLACAVLHDVGIKVSEQKHGYNNGATQEQYGPAVAAQLLASIDFPTDKTSIVQDIIGNHHSPSKYDYPELAILKQADRIVNRDERM
jgi:HD superfamily phosphodiesterase